MTIFRGWWEITKTEFSIGVAIIFGLIVFVQSGRNAESAAHNAYKVCLSDMPSCLSSGYQTLINDYHSTVLQAVLALTMALLASIRFIKSNHPVIAATLLAVFTGIALFVGITMLSTFNGYDTTLTKFDWAFVAATTILYIETITNITKNFLGRDTQKHPQPHIRGSNVPIYEPNNERGEHSMQNRTKTPGDLSPKHWQSILQMAMFTCI